jgi:predicted dehydrogenase
VRVGVVGCGYWGSKHLRVLSGIAGVSGVVGVDPRPDRRTELAAAAGGMTVYAGLSAALPHVDAVVIATPPDQHAVLASQALAAGKHVLVEKPMTTTSGDARRLVEEAAARQLTLMVGHTFEYHAVVWKLREIIESGALGEIYYIDTARLNLGAYQSDVNVVWDLAPHDVSVVNFLLRSRPDFVEAWGSGHVHPHQEDVATLRLCYGDRGVRAQVQVSWLDPCKVRRVTVVGSRGMAVYDDLALEQPLRIYDKSVVYDAHQHNGLALSYRYGGITAPHIELPEPLRVQDAHFVECARSGSRPRSDGDSGLAVVQVLEAAAAAMRRSTQVPVARDDPPAPTHGAVMTSVREMLSQGV